MLPSSSMAAAAGLFHRLFPLAASKSPTLEVGEFSDQDIEPSWHKIDSSSAISDSFISVRLLLFRDADGKPRKLYFDSDTTHRRIRQGESDSSTKITKGHFQGGYEYWYEKSKSDVKTIGEMVYGNLPASGRNVGYKVHFIDNPDQQMWSSTFSPEVLLAQRDTSLNSIGSNLSRASFDLSEGSTCSFSVTDQLCDAQDSSGIGKCYVGRHRTDSSSKDSGVYSVSSNAEDVRSSTSKVGTCSRDLFSSTASLMWVRQRCSLDSQWSMINKFSSEEQVKIMPRFLRPFMTLLKEASADSKMDWVSPTILERPVSGCSFDLPQTRPMTGGRPTSVLGLAVIFTTKAGKSHILSKNTTFLEGVYQKLFVACMDAYKDRHRFIHILYESWLKATQDLLGLFRASWLQQTAWHWLSNVPNSATASLTREKTRHFVSQLNRLTEEFDKKETNFFFSTVLSAFLTHHLGWVNTVADITLDQYKDNFTQSGLWSRLSSLDSFIQSAPPYDPRAVQLMELHGMLGAPCNLTKSVLIGPNADTLRHLIVVLSYFLRCSFVETFPETEENNFSSDGLLETAVPVSEPRQGHSSPYQLYSHTSGVASAASGVILGKVPTSPHLLSSQQGTILMSQDQSAPILHFPKSSCTEEVVFVVGEGERLGSSDCVDATPGTMKCDKRRNYAETDKERVQPEPSTMASTAVRDYSDEPLVDVYVSLQRSTEAFSRLRSSLPSMICQTCESILPGAVLQGCLATSQNKRLALLEEATDLRAHSIGTDFSATPSSECLCITGDLSTFEVRVNSSKKEPMGSSRPLPLFPAPLVVGLLDAVQDAKDLEPQIVLYVIESRLRDILLRSHMLAAYLSREQLSDMDQVVEALGVDCNDIPLLMAVASTHSPSVATRYGVTFR